MLKKIVSVSVLAAGVMLSGPSFATIGVLTGGGSVSALDCSAISNDVMVQLSKGVTAAWGCSTTAFAAATCHTKGTSKSQSLTCDWTKSTDNAGVTTYTATGSTCPSWDGTGNKPAANYTFVGRVGFIGGSGGGSVTSSELPKAACDDKGDAVKSMIPSIYQ